MFRLQHQFNNIVETTKLNNDHMPEFHCHCECSKCSSPAPSNNTSLQSPYLRNLLQPARGRWPQITWSVSLSSELVFSFVISLQEASNIAPHTWLSIGFIFDEFGGQWSFVLISGQLARSQFCALRGVARCVCWRARRAVLLEDESGEQPAIALKER